MTNPPKKPSAHRESFTKDSASLPPASSGTRMPKVKPPKPPAAKPVESKK